MADYKEINYRDIEFSAELLTSLAKALAPEIRLFYEREEGKAYFREWLRKHPEYKTQPDDSAA